MKTFLLLSGILLWLSIAVIVIGTNCRLYTDKGLFTISIFGLEFFTINAEQHSGKVKQLEGIGYTFWRAGKWRWCIRYYKRWW